MLSCLILLLSPSINEVRLRRLRNIKYVSYRVQSSLKLKFVICRFLCTSCLWTVIITYKKTCMHNTSIPQSSALQHQPSTAVYWWGQRSEPPHSADLSSLQPPDLYCHSDTAAAGERQVVSTLKQIRLQQCKMLSSCSYIHFVNVSLCLQNKHLSALISTSPASLVFHLWHQNKETGENHSDPRQRKPSWSSASSLTCMVSSEISAQYKQFLS